MDELMLGSTPAEESCAQVGSDNYAVRARRECAVFIEQLKREFGEPPNGARLKIKPNRHDFGTYYEVAVEYDDRFPEAIEYAFGLEGNASGSWDDKAREELASVDATARLAAVSSWLRDRKDSQRVYWLSPLPLCCQVNPSRAIEDEFVDGPTRLGPWAVMHPSTFAEQGGELGLGKGQKYRRQEDGRWLKVDG